MPLIHSICAVFALCLFFAVAGCGESPQQMFETAQFEELQNNQKHARELYERIIQKHPNSEFAKKAALRLAELQSKPSQ
jgi:outer membrane protein assembly factor BamD (BamD/ComL family)